MKQVEKIWAELSAKAQEVETPQESTELSEEVKVELAGIMDDLKGQMKDANMDAIRGIDMVNDARRLFDKSEQKQKSLVSQFNKGLQYAKELGHDGAITDLNKAIAQAEENLKTTQDMISLLNKF